MDIKLINTSKPQITIINNSSKFDASSLAKISSITTTTTTTNTTMPDTAYFHLNFESSVKFIDIRRKISMLTQVYANNQEWYYYLVKNETTVAADSSYESILATLKTYNDVGSFHRLLQENKVFPLPLTTIIEDNTTLAEMKKLIEELTDESSAHVASAVSSSSPLIPQTSSTSSKYVNSKLTPQNAVANPQQGKGAKSSAPIQMIFVVTVKNANSTTVNNFDSTGGTRVTTSSSSTNIPHQFSIPSKSSNSLVPLGFESLMSLEEDATPMVLGSTPSTSALALNSRRATTSDAETGTGSNKSAVVFYWFMKINEKNRMLFCLRDKNKLQNF